MEKQSQHPNPLLDPMIPAIQSSALVTAAATGLFEALAEGPLDPTTLARRLACDPVGIQRLARLLTALGYLEQTQGRYALSDICRATYVAGGQMALTDWVRFCEVQLKALGHLTAAIQKGRRMDLFDLMPAEAERLIHQRAMAQTALPAADWVAAQVPVPAGAHRMLDVGGSHGVYSAAICRRHPPLVAEVLELPATMATATQVAREHGCDRYVTHRPGDILTTPLEGSYALIFLGNLVHHLTAQNLTRVLEKIAAHTAPGGSLAIWDMAVGDAPADTVAASFGLFFYLTSGAGCHGEAALRAALEAAGFGDVAVKRPPQGTTHMLVTATKR
jgi:SAM-dependent methyltransferase